MKLFSSLFRFAAIILLSAVIITACGTPGEIDGDNDNNVNVTGKWEGEISFVGDAVPLGFIFDQSSGDSVSVLYMRGYVPGGTVEVSGSSLVIDLNWTDNDGYYCTLSGTLSINSNNMIGDATWTKGDYAEDPDTQSVTGTLTLSRTSTSTVVPQFTIPNAAISVDGSVTDWSLVSDFVTDATGDSAVEGTDIKSVRFAQDVNNIYCLVELNTGTMPQNYTFYMRLNDGLNSINVSYNSGWEVYDGNIGAAITGASVSVSGVYVEFSIPKTVFGSTTQFTYEGDMVESSVPADNSAYCGFVNF